MVRHEEVLDEFPFLENDSTYSGAVKVVRTTVKKDKTIDVRHLDLVLSIGEESMRLPLRRDETEMLEAIKSGFVTARQKYKELIEELNKRTP